MISNLIQLIPKYAEMISKSGGYQGNAIGVLFKAHLLTTDSAVCVYGS